MFDSVSAHIPLKIKEKVWAGEYIDMSLMLKSGKDLVYDSQLNGEIAVKGGQLTVLQQKQKYSHLDLSFYQFHEYYAREMARQSTSIS